MVRWRESLFCHRNSGAFQAVSAPQRDMGEVHARAELAMLLVARGRRLPKREIIFYSALAREPAVRGRSSGH